MVLELPYLFFSFYLLPQSDLLRESRPAVEAKQPVAYAPPQLEPERPRLHWWDPRRRGVLEDVIMEAQRIGEILVDLGIGFGVEVVELGSPDSVRSSRGRRRESAHSVQACCFDFLVEIHNNRWLAIEPQY